MGEGVSLGGGDPGGEGQVGRGEAAMLGERFKPKIPPAACILMGGEGAGLVEGAESSLRCQLAIILIARI